MSVPKPKNWRRWIRYVIGLVIILLVVLVILILLGPKDSGTPFISKFDNCDYSLKVIVFADGNSNGKQETGEAGITGVKVVLAHSLTPPDGTPEQNATDSNGSATLINLSYGCAIHDTFTVNVAPPAGYTATTPLSFGPYPSDSQAFDGMTMAAQHPVPGVIYVGLRKS